MGTLQNCVLEGKHSTKTNLDIHKTNSQTIHSQNKTPNSVTYIIQYDVKTSLQKLFKYIYICSSTGQQLKLITSQKQTVKQNTPQTKPQTLLHILKHHYKKILRYI